MASSGNFATFNPLKYKASSYTTGNIDNANRQLGSATGNAGQLNVGFKNGDGKFYYEVYGTTIPSSLHYGVCIDNADLNNVTSGKAIIGYRDSGNKVVSTAPQTNSTQSSYGASYTGGDVMGCAVDFTNGTIEFYKNNSSQGSIDWSSANDGSTYYPYVYQNTGVATINTGQDSTFCGQVAAQGNTDENGFGDFYYTPPSGFLAMCSANLPTDSNIDPAETEDDIPQKNFNAILYTGNGSNGHAITGLGFRPDLVWYMGRSQTAAYSQGLINSTRGTSLGLYSDRSDAETAFTNDFASFDSDGFTLNAGSSGNINNTGKTFVAWCWRANGGTTSSNGNGSITSTVQVNPAGTFSIVKYTGTGSNATVGHGLSSAPAFILFKRLTSPAQNWKVYHKALGATKVLTMNAYTVAETDSTMFNNTEPTSTVFSIGTQSNTNTGSSDHIAFCWTNSGGYQKFGNYIGNNIDNNGPYCYTGFRPRMVAIKGATEAYGWYVFDSARSPNNLVDRQVSWYPGGGESEEPTGARKVDFLSNGFRVMADAASINGSNDEYVYMAWGDVPAKYNNAF